jgi:hypothetical protein
MRVERQSAVGQGSIEVALFVLAVLWYLSFAFGVVFNSGKNVLDTILWPWLLTLTFGPLFSLALAVAMYLALRQRRRGIRLHEILLVVFVAPQFLGAVYIWLGLLSYM